MSLTRLRQRLVLLAALSLAAWCSGAAAKRCTPDGPAYDIEGRFKRVRAAPLRPASCMPPASRRAAGAIGPRCRTQHERPAPASGSRSCADCVIQLRAPAPPAPAHPRRCTPLAPSPPLPPRPPLAP